MGGTVATGLNVNLAGVVRFGVYEVDPHAGELRRNGVKVKLQEQPFQVLALLLERPGEVITREEMQRRLWPADTFVDFDHSLNAAVKRLRDALRDSADNPRFVETLARRGYRFVAPVAGMLPADGSAARSPGATTNGRTLAAWAAAVIVLIGACVSLGWYIGHGAGPGFVPREVRLTANSPDVPVYRASMSPDARLLAFTDPRGLFLREINREESHQVNLPEGFRAHTVIWFPDWSHL
jgi:DNA-binding winged helix-turn-helix (wHTH) protein